MISGGVLRRSETSWPATASIFSRKLKSGTLLLRGREYRQSLMTLYSNSYKKFASMQVGNTVALMLPGKPKIDQAYFGVFSHEEPILKDEETPRKEKWSALQLLQLDVFNSMMFRKVKWMRYGLTRDLPSQTRGKNGSDSFSWLAESSGFWFLARTESDIEKNHLELMRKKRLEAMRSREFFERATPFCVSSLSNR